MDAHFAYARTNRSDVAGVAKAQPRHARSDFGSGSFIREIRKPVVEFIGRQDLEHTVSYRIHVVASSRLGKQKGPGKTGALDLAVR